MVIPIRFGGYQPERSVHTKAARDLGARLSQRFGAALDFQITPQITATGREAADLLNLTEAGELDMCYFASSYLAARVPELAILDLPFEGLDRAAIWRRLDGAAGNLLKIAVARRTGFTVLGFWDNGLRHISNGVRAIHRPGDCKGLSIRTLDNDFHRALFTALGFEPRFIDVKDLAGAVRDRLIDAQENPLTNLLNFAIHETHRHISLTGHFFGIALLLANARAIAGWPARVHDEVLSTCREATEVQRDLAAREDEQCLGLLRAAGVEVLEANELDLGAFRHAVAGIVADAKVALDSALLAAWRA